MIGRELLPELKALALIEGDLVMRSEPVLGGLVVPNGNASAPVHRWFHYKEAFSSNLVEHLVRFNDLDLPGSAKSSLLLDPYCGVGTGLLSAQLSGRRVKAVGIECNPLSAFIARTKLAWSRINPARFRALATRLLEKTFTDSPPLPSLSSIRSGRCISIHMAKKVLQYRDAILRLPAGPERDALMLGLAAAVEPVSKIRRDGRALRIVSKQPTKLRVVLQEKWSMIADDVELLQGAGVVAGKATVFQADGRRPSSAGVRSGSVDVIVTSPPYPNNIDYNEVYKLEMWLLGHVEDSSQFLTLRKQTYRSHPTCSSLDDSVVHFKEFRALMDSELFSKFVGPVFEKASILDLRGSRQRMKMLEGYIYDTWRSLRAHFNSLKLGGQAFYVVGNSLHGGAETPYLVPTDLLFGLLGEAVGFRVEKVSVARGLPRRLSGNHFLRDSIVHLVRTS